VALCATGGIGLSAQTIHGREGIVLPPPPATEAIPVTDDYFGTKVTDNYRWLEDAKSLETRDFIDAQNAYTERYLKQARIRPQILDDLDELEHVSLFSLPIERGGNDFFEKRLAGEEQASICVRRGSSGQAGSSPATPGKDERLVDPAALSRDPDTSVEMADVSRDATLVAYRLRQGGADETVIHVFNVKTGKTLEDELPSARYGSVSFAPDGASFYYARGDKAGTLLYQHVLGNRVSKDTVVFGREFYGEELGPNDLLTAQVTDDGRYLVVQVDRGVPARRVDIVFRNLTKPGAFFDVLIWGLDSRFSAVYASGAWYVKTDYQAPKGRILKADPGILPDAWTTIVPEGPDVIAGFSIVGGKLYVQRLKDVKPETSIYTLNGKLTGQLDYDAIGTASQVKGSAAGRYGFFSFQSFLQPPTVYRLDTLTGKREIFAQTRIPVETGFDPSQYEVKQVFAKSKDGTQIPIFIAGKKGLKQDGTERLLMTGQGGFGLSVTPAWNPAYAWWLQQGGWLAVPSLRGGGEYGLSWHEQGMLEKKQNAFDDWFAAAEYLIAGKYTSSARLAIAGRADSGLLMGASIAQRPELFSAVWCGDPLLDMLRYQKFLQGSWWKTEFGSAENEKQFAFLLKYSPFQNVKTSTAYPAVMLFNGENSARASDSEMHIDPLHARKMTARLQAASSSGRPILLTDSRSGGQAGSHSAGGGVERQIQQDAGELTFLWTETAHPAHQK
jgi:prolyl oligopeptidase